MRTARRNHRQPRAGMTLIELIVVMSIIVIIAALGVFLVPRLQSEKGSRGAQDLQGALMQAKYRALRDKSPKGIRLIPDPADATKIRSFMFIEQPGTWTGGQISYQGATPNTFFVTGADLSGGLGGDSSLWPVQPGDYLYVSGQIHGVITGVVTTSSPQRITVTGDNPTGDIAATASWYVVRGPRAIPGEEVVNLPDGVAVDLANYWGNPAGSPPYNGAPLTNLGQPLGPYDIMFAPAGTVTGRYVGQGQIYLWVRDTTRLQTDPGEQIVIVIYTRTGQIGAYSVDTTAGQDPLSFRNDPKFRPSGL